MHNTYNKGDKIRIRNVFAAVTMWISFFQEYNALEYKERYRAEQFPSRDKIYVVEETYQYQEEGSDDRILLVSDIETHGIYIIDNSSINIYPVPTIIIRPEDFYKDMGIEV